ncbi:rod shape-determining protein [Clostridium sp. cel8]|jgi:cell division protein FtsA|uniref:cell division protein FtsA n=1 Tax=unclassified Clostridium TaxID=2614128 RepID=UPI0015F5E1CB|nr:cell division FtsA domain-containing protein [Clostridium sp. cel8]MBA5851894.1 rod shape-determining protein [Clostridium sp. cel8]
MSTAKLNSQDVIFALDIGTRTVIGTAGIVKDKKFHVISEYCLEHEQRAMIDGQIHDVGLVANTVLNIKEKIEKDLNMKLENVVIAAAGRFLRTIISKESMKIDYDKEIDKDTIRSLELTAVSSAESKINKDTKGRLYCVGYSVKNYYLNGYLIGNLLSQKGSEISAEVIATFLPRSVVDSLYSVMKKVGLNVISLTLEPIAAMEAAVPKSLRILNLALVDIGAGTSDIAISCNDSITAYGMVPKAGDEVTEVIAQNYLVDFNSAEKIKKECSVSEKIVYTDVLGIENTVPSEEVIKLITPTVKKIADEISSKIISLNGDKSPNAVFLVGGGAHTPKIHEFLAENLGIQPQRIAVKGRESVKECVCTDNSLESTGVTVLGIALVSIRRLGHDFIDVMLNGSVISMFNSHKHTVMDVLMQAGISPKLLIGKNGKNIRFVLNGIKRVAFGTLGKNAKITINGFEKGMDAEIKEGDKIEVEYSVDGKNASPKVIDYISKAYSVSFFVNGVLENLEPIAYKDDNRVDLDYCIKENDNIKIIIPKTIGDYKKYFAHCGNEAKFYLNGKILEETYEIKEGDRISLIYNDISIDSKDKKIDIKDEKNEKDGEKVNVKPIENINKDKIQKLENNKNEITVIANGKPIVLNGKKKYIFVDIFNHVEFDLSNPKGELYLSLNGKNAGYYDKLSEGDVIEIGWK